MEKNLKEQIKKSLNFFDVVYFQFKQENYLNLDHVELYYYSNKSQIDNESPLDLFVLMKEHKISLNYLPNDYFRATINLTKYKKNILKKLLINENNLNTYSFETKYPDHALKLALILDFYLKIKNS